MAKDKMIEIDVSMPDGSKKHLTESAGISIGEIADKVFKGDSREYVAARSSGKLRELTRKLSSSCEVEFITPHSVIGFDMYKRSLILLMLSAIDNVVDNLEKLYESQEELRNEEMELKEAIIDNTAYWNAKAESMI